MLGDRVRTLREARAWTQEHLAEAAGVSPRTIQRLETGAGFASETALAVAAALEVDVRELLDPGERPMAEGKPLWPRVPMALAATAGLLLAVPAILFVAVNLIRDLTGFALPYRALESSGIAHALDSPWILLGGPLLALAALGAAIIQPRGEWSEGNLTLSGVIVRPRTAPLLLAAGALAALACLFAHLTGETLGPLLH